MNEHRAALARLVAAGLYPVAATAPTYPVSRDLLPPFVSSGARFIWPAEGGAVRSVG